MDKLFCEFLLSKKRGFLGDLFLFGLFSGALLKLLSEVFEFYPESLNLGIIVLLKFMERFLKAPASSNDPFEVMSNLRSFMLFFSPVCTELIMVYPAVASSSDGNLKAFLAYFGVFLLEFRLFLRYLLEGDKSLPRAEVLSGVDVMPILGVLIWLPYFEKLALASPVLSRKLSNLG